MKLYQRLIKLLKKHKLMLIGLALSGLIINLSGQDIIITSDDFSVDSTGKIFAKSGTVGGYSLTENSFYSEIYPLKDYTMDDYQKIVDYLMDRIELTDEEKILYDIDGNGIIDARDVYFIINLMNTNVSTTQRGTIHINNRDPINTIVLKDGYGEVRTRIGLLGIDANVIDVETVNGENASKSGITVGVSENYTASTTNETIYFDKQISVKEDKINLIGNQIEIGKGITCVDLSAAIGLSNYVANQTPMVRIFKNGEELNVYGITIPEAWSNAWLIIPSFLINVTEGDILELKITGNNGDVTVRNTSYMTVKQL